MKRIETLALSIVLLAFVTTLPARESNENRYTFPLTGASFASPNNGRFEAGCELTGATPLNRAIGGEAIADAADRHDGRETYNASVRKPAEKQGFPPVEFDKYISFSKNSVHPVTKEQASLLFTDDSQQITGRKFGWRPENGRDSYIRRRMGAIFADTIRKIFPTSEIC
ncbi:MAG: DUF5040 domain-containing protein [Proteiniphilum sp.]|jgi:hypothetical protein|nr:DUF5040 domain-containing protein [Proteiniphilum sp.]